MAGERRVTGPRRVVTQLVLVTSVVGLLTGALGLGVVRQLERSTSLATSGDAALASAERTASVVDGRVGALLAQLELFATRGELAAFGDEAAAELAVALRVTDELDELTLYDSSGRPVAAAPDPPPDAAEPLAPVAPDGPDGARARLDVDGDAPTLVLTAPIESPAGTRVGVLVARAAIAPVVDEVTLPASDDGRVALVAPDGTTVADGDRQRVIDGYRQPLDALPSQRPVARVDGADGPALLAAAPLTTLDAVVVVEVSEAAIDGADGAALRGPAGVLLAVVLAIVLAVIATGRRLLRPLGPLADGVRRLTAGERGVRVDEAGIGEVADLARGFNHMAAALELRQRDLEAAERGARLNEERLRLVVEGVEGYAIVLLDVLGDVRTWNAGAARVTGRGAEELVGRRLTDLAAADEPITDPVPAATRAGRGEAEGWFVRPDGSRFWGELTVTALRRDDGAVSGYAAILQDVTERRAARHALEEALLREQQAAAELRHANVLKDEFLAVAAHEIRTPLAAILGSANVLAPGPFALDPAEAEEIRRIIWHHANDMHGIVERLLDVTELQAGRVRIEPRAIALRETLAQVVRASAHDLADREVALDVDAGEVVVDPRLLAHVAGNLVANAAKFSPPDAGVRVTAHVAGELLELTVTDEGPGIAPEDHERIFELFRQSSQTEPSARGMGLGLTIVRRYVELVGGEVTVESALGEGATFTVRLPLGPPAAQSVPSSGGRGTTVG
jgi:PAS domain S-box-containing protein